VSGRLITNIFAGDTINSERTFITGSTEKFDYRKSADSYARYFNEQGYITEFCHPCYGWFYNRQNVFEYLGFSSLWFFETRYTMPDGWGMMHDGAFLGDLTELYSEATSDGTPFFNFSVTYQNHGPYDDGKRGSDTTYYSAPGLSEAGSNIFNNYLAGIAETDDAMRSFIDYFRSLDEPVIIVFFGDHNPWLGDGSWVYDEIGIDIDLSTDEGFYNHYSTQYIIWANDSAKAVLGNDFTATAAASHRVF
jgi:phosphoglycerol transferase MdoB-like AlkP superfamily enzyme